ncbi:MAG: NusG domain II-containing protein [Eubacteriales bacterium]|nr:NusG domain II-containing protein [Eubacteriales bacterium]
MSYGTFKEEKPFKKGDIIVYAVVAIVIVAVSLAVYLPNKNTEEITRFDVFFGEEKLFSYDFSTKRITITEFGKDKINVTDGEKIRVNIATEKGSNELEIGERYVKMVVADCSSHPDCVEKFSPLTTGGKAIVCLPHAIKVVSYGGISSEVKI